MAAKNEGVETRPASVNKDEESRQKVGAVADGVDKATRDLVVHDTTTRDRTVRAKRAHEPLDLADADDDQPAEDGNGPRAKEVGPSDSSKASGTTVSEAQVKAGADARNGKSDDK
jgi:hypothetical protein